MNGVNSEGARSCFLLKSGIVSGLRLILNVTDHPRLLDGEIGFLLGKRTAF
jgi:hypothetical protein